MSKEKLLAFRVTTDHAPACILVWARSRSEAKRLAFRSLWFEDTDWIDLRTYREPKADGLRDTPQAMDDDCSQDDMRLLRSLEWHELDGREDPCTQCGLYEWSKVPESQIDSDTGKCAECSANKTTGETAHDPN